MEFKKNHKKNKSFSIIEILIYILISSFLFKTSLSFFSNYLEETKLSSNVDKLLVLFDLAKKKSMLGDQENNYCQSKGSKIFAYGINKASNKINLCLYCANSYDYCNVLKSEIISQNFNINTNGFDQILFYPIEGKTNINAVWQIKNKFINRCVDIEIDELGLVKKNVPYPC